MVDFALAPVVLGTGGTTSLPAWMGNVDMSSITTTAESLAGVVVPVIIAIVGITIGIKLLKSYLKKIGG